MANVNKVIVNGVTKLDLTADTVTAGKLLSGYTAHDSSGTEITGTATPGASVEVIAYTSFPPMPVQNAIGVITSSAITSYVFQQDEPDHSEGRIWLKVGEDGKAYNLVPDGSIRIKLYAVYQSVSGAWVQKQARIGGTSAWGDLINVQIAYNGGYMSGASGSWYSSNQASRSSVAVDGVTVWQTTNKTNAEGYSYLCVGPIDVTNFHYLHSELYNYRGSYTYGGRLYISREKGSSNILNNGAKITSKTIAQTTTSALDLDVSDITGTVYVYTGIQFGSYAGTRYCQINRIWGE